MRDLALKWLNEANKLSAQDHRYTGIITGTALRNRAKQLRECAAELEQRLREEGGRYAGPVEGKAYAL